MAEPDLYYVRKPERVRAWQWNGQEPDKWPTWLTATDQHMLLTKGLIIGTFIINSPEFHEKQRPRSRTMGPELFHSQYEPEPVEIPEMDATSH